MESKVKEQIKSCLELFRRIKEEYPEGEFDREMLHGDLDQEYRRIKEIRDKIDRFPQEIKTFCKFISSVRCAEQEILKFLSSIIASPEIFSEIKQATFMEGRKKTSEIAQRLGLKDISLSHLLLMGRSLGLLKENYALKQEYQEIIRSYLARD